MKKMIQAVATFSLIFGATGAFAQSALSQLAGQAGVEVSPLAKQFQALQESVQARPVAIPRQPKDILAGCMAIDAKALSLVAWTLPQAVGQVQSCLNKVYATGDARLYSVNVKAARFGVKVCPNAAAGMFSCQAFEEVEGLEITIDGKILTGDPVLSDLNFSLQSRKGKLLGYHAILQNNTEVLR